MTIRPEVLPFVAGVVLVFGLLALILRVWATSAKWVAWICVLSAVVGVAYLLYFFRDPKRHAPTDASAVVSGADGRVMSVTRLREEQFLKADCVRISIFLSLFDVHVNRAPISGKSTFLGYFPGKRLFTFQEKSSEVNQHNKILIEGEHTRCLVNQIVGPVCRRVVYWLAHDKPAEVAMGDRIGMMKFGSRLDIYLPTNSVDVVARPGDTVRAGETIIARMKGVPR